MTNHPSPRKARDSNCVNVDDEHELRYWTKKFGCTNEQLKEAVKKVGTNPEAVRAELGLKVPPPLVDKRQAEAYFRLPTPVWGRPNHPPTP